MKKVCLCIHGKHALCLPPEAEFEIILEDLPSIEAMLVEESFYGRTIVISGSGDVAYHAARLAMKYKKRAIINGIEMSFSGHGNGLEAELANNLKLLSLCTEEGLYRDVATFAVNSVIKACPSKMAVSEARSILEKFCPNLTIEKRSINESDNAADYSTITAKEYALHLFEERLQQRYEQIKSRISFDFQHQRLTHLFMLRDDASKYIKDNRGVFIIKWPPGAEKTNKVTKRLFESATLNDKTLLITSSISLTNGMYSSSDTRNYRTALEKGVIDEQVAIASTINSAVLSQAFSKFVNDTAIVVFEEVESVRDAIVSDHMGDGSLQSKVTAQRKFNELLNKPTVVLVDAALSQNTLDHLLKNTERQIFVIHATDSPSKKTKKITYYKDKNVAVEAIAKLSAKNKKIALYSDFKHRGDESKLEALKHQIVEVIAGNLLQRLNIIEPTAEQRKSIRMQVESTLNAKLVDAAFLKANKEYVDDPNALLEQYDLVLSTPAIRNGVSIEAHCDLIAMIMCGANNLSDIYQTGERNRPCGELVLTASDPQRGYPVSKKKIFVDEACKKIRDDLVDATITRFENDEAARDVVDRIQFLNSPKADFTNNLITMYELLGFEINYDYSSIKKDADYRSKRREIDEKFETYRELADWDKVMKAAHLEMQEIEALDIKDKRLNYASQICRFYNITANHDLFESIVSFDRGGKGRAFVKNLHVIRGLDELGDEKNLFISTLFGNLFKHLEIDPVTLSGNFSKNNFDRFKTWVDEKSITLADRRESTLIDLVNFKFPNVSTKQSAAFVKGLLRDGLGLKIEKATKQDEQGNKIDLRTDDEFRHRMLRIAADDAVLLNKAYSLFSQSNLM